MQGPVGTLTCNVGDLASGASANMDVTVLVDGGAPSGGTLQTGACNGSEDLCNTVSVTATETDTDPSNNSDDEPTDVISTAIANLSIAKTDLSSPVEAGGYATYQLTATNAGPSAADNVMLTDMLDPNTMFFTSTDDRCVLVTVDTVECSLGTMAAGTSETVEIIVRVAPTAPTASSISAVACSGSEDVCNAVWISSSTTDPDASDDTDDVATDVIPATTQVNLSVIKVDDIPEPVKISEVFSYTLSVTNSGPDDAYDVMITEHLDPGTALVSDTGGCTVASSGTVGGGEVLSCDLGTVPAFASVQLQISVVVTAAASAGVSSAVYEGTCDGSENLCNAAFLSTPAAETDETDNAADEGTAVVSSICGDGILDVGEQCDPPSAEICNNAVDDDGNGAYRLRGYVVSGARVPELYGLVHEGAAVHRDSGRPGHYPRVPARRFALGHS